MCFCFLDLLLGQSREEMGICVGTKQKQWQQHREISTKTNAFMKWKLYGTPLTFYRSSITLNFISVLDRSNFKKSLSEYSSFPEEFFFFKYRPLIIKTNDKMLSGKTEL